jgi:pyruvate dehydrogenase complex dehydrogenase (E1) component
LSFPIAGNSFWSKFTTFIANKGLKHVSVLTTAGMLGKGEMEEEISKRYGEGLPVTIKHEVRWEEVSSLIDKKPDKLG